MQTLEHDTTRLWGKQLKIVHFDIWCRLEVGCSEMPVKCQYCFKLNDATDVANWTAKGLSPCEQPLKNDVLKFLLCNCCTWSRT